MSEIDNKDIESFTHDLGVAIYEINKKHDNILYKINLGNSMSEFFRFVKRNKKENKNERKERIVQKNKKINSI